MINKVIRRIIIMQLNNSRNAMLPGLGGFYAKNATLFHIFFSTTATEVVNHDYARSTP